MSTRCNEVWMLELMPYKTAIVSIEISDIRQCKEKIRVCRKNVLYKETRHLYIFIYV